MNFIMMMNWRGFWRCSIQFGSLFALLFFVANFESTKAQTEHDEQIYTDQLVDFSSQNSFKAILLPLQEYNSFRATPDTVDYFPDYPDPTSVLFKSMIIPGWGQVVNDQIWKVPIIYGLLGGLTYYSIYLTKRYHDYRAAYYNLNEETPDDLRFGPTPPYISPNTSLSFLRSTRNSLRNRRDFSYVLIALAYGLNIIDAYVFAHLKPFDVSEDLSVNAALKPTMVTCAAPGFTLSFELY